MCIVSAVHQGFQPAIPNHQQWPLNPAASRTLTDVEILRVITLYREALAKAEEADTITGQPDCEDPEKAKLLERVAEIEALLAEVKEELSPEL